MRGGAERQEQVRDQHPSLLGMLRNFQSGFEAKVLHLREDLERHGGRLATVAATVLALMSDKPAKAETCIGCHENTPANSTSSVMHLASADPITILRAADGSVASVNVDLKALKAMKEQAERSVNAALSSSRDLQSNPTHTDHKGLVWSWQDSGFKLWNVIAPIAWRWEDTNGGALTFKAVLPERYAREFHQDPQAGLPLRSSDVDSLESQLNRAIVANADRLGINPDSLSTLSASIIAVGKTSEEARTPQSVGAGVVDPENILLGEVRGESGRETFRAILNGMGIAVEGATRDSSGKLSGVSGTENLLSPPEREALLKFAEQNGFLEAGEREDEAAVKQGVFRLYQDYNAERLSEEQLRELDPLIAAKRVVEVTVQIEGTSTDRKHFYFPVALLLPLLALRRRRDDQPSQPDPQPVPEPRPEPTPPRAYRDEDYQPRPPVEPTVVPPVVVAPPSEGEQSGIVADPGEEDDLVFVPLAVSPEQRKREEDEERTLLVDVQPHFAFYQEALDGMWRVRAELGNLSEEGRHAAVTRLILDEWKANDIKLGADPNEDYHKNPHQIYWAKLHADLLLKLHDSRYEAEQKAATDAERENVANWDYSVDLDRHAAVMRERKELRNAANVQVVYPEEDDQIVIVPLPASSDAIAETAPAPAVPEERAVVDEVVAVEKPDYSKLSKAELIALLESRDLELKTLADKVAELQKAQQEMLERLEQISSRVTSGE